MNRLAASQLIGMSAAADQPAGTVVKVTFDLPRGLLLGLLIETPNNQTTVGYLQDGLTLAGRKILLARPPQPLEAGSLADRARLADPHLIGAAVRSESGEILGQVEDVVLDKISWSIHQLVVADGDGERLVPRAQIKEMTDDQVIVFDALAKNRATWHAGMRTDPVAA